MATTILVALLAGGCVTTTEPPVEAAAATISAEATSQIVDLAGKAVSEERFADAQKLLERVLLHHPTHPRARLLMAEVLLAAGKRDEALQAFAALAEAESPIQAAALQGKGIAIAKRHGFSEAATILSKAVSLDPTLWRAWSALGYCHDQKSEWEESETAYANALAASPDNALLYNNRGFSRLMQQRPQEAAADFISALRQQPDLRVAEANLRLALAWNGDYQRALSGVPRTEIADALNNVGFVAILRGDLKNAESYLVRAMEAAASYNALASRNLDYLQSLREAGSAPKTKG